ncbi:hypothetical protein Cob_v000490 [Colletotrichum orbiculare MAFF 240422]|uniref:Uncharacterized protein n=1 Tax=Colletotrichum orbiculare (strain 104-T / ATCC 96160 / CBS 514.97 / LARS 414 / MAFF 240422) TaxID=1213857 RepID=A0A484G866_COLOR|nr:hypothetical protein Cob_v000490 [Colletotrichum orbiculare MAFF 240422]
MRTSILAAGLLAALALAAPTTLPAAVPAGSQPSTDSLTTGGDSLSALMDAYYRERDEEHTPSAVAARAVDVPKTNVAAVDDLVKTVTSAVDSAAAAKKRMITEFLPLPEGDGAVSAGSGLKLVAVGGIKA